MPSTVYRGDLAEISFGHESGVYLKHDYTGSFRFHALAKYSENTSTLYFAGGAANTPCASGVLKYPQGMLVGSQLIFSDLSGTNNLSNSTFDELNNASTGRTFTIVGHTLTSSVTRLVISPALVNQSDAALTSTAGSITVLPFKTPTFDTSMVIAANANASAERVLTDQFLGIVNTIALPETKIDLKRMHVVGLGRDVAVQVPGRFINQGGSFEANLHNSRWFYYALGEEVSHYVTTSGLQSGGEASRLNVDVSKHASYLTFTATDGTYAQTPYIASIDTPVVIGDYVVINDSGTLYDDVVTDVSNYMGTVATGVFPTITVDNDNIITQAKKQEIRRIVGYSYASNVGQIWLDSPLNFNHPSTTSIKFIRLDNAAANGSPNLDVTTGGLTNPVQHLYYSKSSLPSFSLEVSVRRNDNTETGVSTTEVVDGGASDAKQLTRVFRGCKVKDFVLTADSDAALRMTTNFDAALCYTDTGRLETSNKGDRYDAHRLFEDTSETLIKRKTSGIAKGTQKPFMFYNGIIRMAGVQLGQVVSFTLNGKTGVEQHYVIGGTTHTDSETDQVPFAGSRNASLAIEGKTEYDLEMEIIVDDPLLYHNMRRAVHNFDDVTSDTADIDLIRLSFTKQGTGSVRESIDILIDDYFITEAPLPIPEDKGPMKAVLKIMPKNIKVVSQDTILHA